MNPFETNAVAIEWLDRVIMNVSGEVPEGINPVTRARNLEALRNARAVLHVYGATVAAEFSK